MPASSRVTTKASAADLLVPRILVVDDERQIHASLRLRLAANYSLVCHSEPHAALALLQDERFDLCLVDIHMPDMNGLAFIEAAQQVDPDLGFIVLSAFDTDENLRRTIPLGVYDFISKPLPNRQDFEARVPQWIDQTRRRRQDHALARQAQALADELDSAKLEREVELVASETARDALLQTSNLLTTLQALVSTSASSLATRARTDPSIGHIVRSLEEARKTTDAAVSVAEGFFDSAYGARDASPALVNDGVRHAMSIAMRMCGAERDNKTIDFTPADTRMPIRGLTGIEFLLMMVPAIAAAVARAPANSTIGISAEQLARVETPLKDTRFREALWVNRKRALTSHPGIMLVLTSAAAPLSRVNVEGWLNGQYAPLASVSARGLAHGVQKCHGLLGVLIPPHAAHFQLLLALPI